MQASELKRPTTSADYANIEKLGLAAANAVAPGSVSVMTDYPAMDHKWRLFESGCRDAGFDVFRAWPQVELRAKALRFQLHWLTAVNLDAEFSGDPFVHVAMRDAAELKEKNAAYGESWKRRGGPGAFMMLARKWDRMDNILAPTGGGSHMELLRKNPGDVLDDIGDLRRYLLLVEDECSRIDYNTLPAERNEMAWVRDVVSLYMGYSGPLAPACCPLGDWLKELLERRSQRTIDLTPAEVQSDHSRLKWAEGLVRLLPTDHDGRNSWLLNYGRSEEAQASQQKRGLVWDERTQSAVQAPVGHGG